MNPNPLSFMRMNTQFENVGDALINRELIRLLMAHSDLVMEVSSTPPSFVDELLEGIDRSRVTLAGSFPAMVLAAVTARARGRACHYFYLPGGITGEKGSKKALTFRATTAAVRLLALLGVRVSHLGASYSSLGPRNIKIVRERVSFMHHHFVRDTVTRDYLQNIGIRVDGILPDFSFALYDKCGAPNGGPVTAFSFRLDRGGDAANGGVQRIVSRIISSGPSDARYRFVSQVRRDDAPMQALAARMTASFGERIAFRSAETIDGTCTLYADVGRIYSNRLHALLVAAFMGAVPVACVERSKDFKISGLFADLGLGANLVFEDDDAAMVAPVAPDYALFRQQSLKLRQIFAELFAR